MFPCFRWPGPCSSFLHEIGCLLSFASTLLGCNSTGIGRLSSWCCEDCRSLGSRMTASSCLGAPGSGLFAQYCTEWRGRSSCFASRLGLRRLVKRTKDSKHGLCFGCFVRSQQVVPILELKECEDSGLSQCSWSMNIVCLVTICAG